MTDGTTRRLDSEAEVRKLAHALGVEPQRLSMVAGLPAEDLRTLRAQVAEAMFQAGRPAFVRVGNLSKAIPGALAAKLTEATLPPLLAARTSEVIEPARALDLVSRMSDGFLADVSAVMDPARSRDVVEAIPADRVATVGRELARRKEWVAIGGFVSYVSPDGLRASVANYDGEQLLRIGFVIDDLTKLDAINDLLTDEQVDTMLESAGTAGLWDELADQLEHLSPERVARIAERFAVVPDEVRERIRGAARDGDFPADALALLEGR